MKALLLLSFLALDIFFGFLLTGIYCTATGIRTPEAFGVYMWTAGSLAAVLGLVAIFLHRISQEAQTIPLMNDHTTNTDEDTRELWDAVQQAPLADLQRSIQNYEDEAQRTTELLDAEGAAIEAAEFPHRTPREQLAQLIEAQGYELDRGSDVRDWPADEQELHRRPDWGSFDIRAAAVQQYRREKLADALLTAGWQPPKGTA